ncbi:cytochrome P450 [Aerosakkonemataceae cyanobacterium BLCC-F50]|uniref:Cytochrome P450 n=1 Tax=Floridaenema flaviceps BLCC-F50 TaxID=3153642 RepID=A0ABV4XRA1_9CYAN
MKLPQGPKTPGIVQLFQWIADPLGLMDDCAQRYGDMFTLRVGTNCRPIVFLTNPQAIKEVFTADYKQFASGHANELARPLAGQNSLFLMDGDRHKRERQLLLPPFHGENIRSYGELIRNITLAVTKDWQIGQTLIVRDVMQEITLRVILRAVFGLEEGERDRELRHLLSEMLDNISSPLNSALLFFPQLQKDLGTWSPWSKFLRRQSQITELLMAEIHERRANFDPSRKDILSLLMSAKDEAGNPMTDAELHDELLTLLVAGHETTATSLAWALYSIHHVPGVLDKLLHEIDSLGENPDPNLIAKLPYLTAICNETLRIYPILFITFGRVAQSPVKIMGKEFEPGTSLAPCIYLTHRRKDLYPEPEKFKPERFLEKQFSPYEFFPFGGGTRRCIGIALAPYEMKIVLATILANWQLSLADKTPVKPIRRGFTLGPKGGVRMVIKNKK